MYVIPVRIIRFGVNHLNFAMSLSYDDLNSDFDVDPALQVLELCESNSAPQFNSRTVREIDPQESKC